MKDFVMIPYSLIHDNELGEKRVIIYSSILFSGWSGRDYKELLRYADYSLCRNSSGVLSQFKDTISQMLDKNFLAYKDGGMVYIKNQEAFGTIHYSDFIKILQERKLQSKLGNRINHSRLLLLLAHLRLFISYRPDSDGYSNLLIRISESIGIPVRSISECLKILERLELIHSITLPRYKDKNGKWHSNVRVFTNTTRDNRDQQTENFIYNNTE